MASQKILKFLPNILTTHFSSPILTQHCLCAIGYGSGIFPQSSTNPNINNTIDIMLIVKNAHIFHQHMLSHQPTDYAGLPRIFGAGYLGWLGKNVFPAHFNHVSVQGVRLKYAVIQLETLLEDLRTWKLLTFAGRLHKPVAYNLLSTPQPAPLTSSLRTNHKMALNIALLNLLGKHSVNEPIPLATLYRYISNVSYAGDIRHTMAVENVNKVDNIVRNNMEAFDGIYLPLLRELADGVKKGEIVLDGRNVTVRYTPELIDKIFQRDQFPAVLRQHFQEINQGKFYKNITQKVLLNGVNQIPKEIQAKLSKINRNSSIRMAAQNFLGASLTHNFKYIMAKINKKKTK